MKSLKKILKDFDNGEKINKKEAVQLAGVFVTKPVKCGSGYVIYYPYNMKRFGGASAEFKTTDYCQAKDYGKIKKAVLAATMLGYCEKQCRDVEVALLKDSSISIMKALSSIKQYKVE